MIPDADAPVFAQIHYLDRTIRPFGAAQINGLTTWENSLLALDDINGYLLHIDVATNNTKIINPRHWSQSINASGLAIFERQLWFAQDEDVYFCSLDGDLTPQHFVRLDYPVDGVAVWQSTVYLSCQRTGEILVFARESAREITRWYAPGIGKEKLTVRDEELWACDSTEQTVYCLDRATGEVIFTLLTPYEQPTGITFYRDPQTQQERLYIAYASREPYIRDNPNLDPNYELQYRDRTFIHPLYFHYHRQGRYTLSNGYLVEMSYVEELAPLKDNLELQDVAWHIALPAQTQRQRVLKVESIGLPFEEIVEDGQRVAVFKFDRLTAQDRQIFGWKALLELYSIKYQLQPQDGEQLPDLPPQYQQRYLVDDDELAMDTPIIRDGAIAAVGGETNFLRQIYNIRNYVYDQLSYGIRPHIDSPDVVLERGVGSCGEYLGVLLALARLNGIACRTVGRYKCPSHPLVYGIPLQPDFNHVWMEFYLPGFGWLPMESNPDDIAEGGPYPTRFFMGLAWYHTEIAKSIPFERLFSGGERVSKEDISLGELAINHVQYQILQEIVDFQPQTSIEEP